VQPHRNAYRHPRHRVQRGVVLAKVAVPPVHAYAPQRQPGNVRKGSANQVICRVSSLGTQRRQCGGRWWAVGWGIGVVAVGA